MHSVKFTLLMNKKGKWEKKRKVESGLIYPIMFIMHLWQETDEAGEVSKDTRYSLLMMNFSVDEVDLAIKRLGM